MHPGVPVAPLPSDVNVYLNWVIYAVLGRMAEADELLRLYGASVRRMAAWLHWRRPLTLGRLYRGMLLVPGEPVVPDPRLMFVSWTEALDVARWFAMTTSTISEPLVASNPALRGYVLTLDGVTPEQVLWHHSWRRAFGIPLPTMAAAHPYVGDDGALQVAHSLATQHEVILAPPASFPAPEPVEAFPGVDAIELDRQLVPPHCWLS